MAKATATKTKPAESDEALEDLDADEETTGNGSKSQDVTFGVADLCKHVEETTGKAYKPKDMRTLIRKLARDGKVDREIVAGNKSRYDWSGPDDPEVKRIVKAVAAGGIEASRKEALDALKAKKQAERAAKKAAAEAASADEDEE